MNKYRGTKKDIHIRIYSFVVGCIKDLIKKIPHSVENIELIKQLIASLTSVGANDQEADASLSKKDFASKYTIVRKELKETMYWISLLKDIGSIDKQIAERFLKEGNEIYLIIAAIIKSTRV